MAAACVAGALVLAATGSPGAPEGPPPAPSTSLARVYTGTVVSLPFVLATPHLDFLYASGWGSGVNIPLRTFTTMGRWSRVYNPLPVLPTWVEPGTSVWSPDVRRVGHHYVMWFSAVANDQPAGDTQDPAPRCLGWARSPSPYGPFVSPDPRPALCQWSEFGDIDPRTFVDHGQEYLLWKSDDNAGMTPPGHTYKPTKLWSQRLAADGTTLEGSPTLLLTNSEAWEGAVVEAPDLVRAGGRYFLFFSSTYSFSLAEVAGIGVATCAGPAGPCRAERRGPWLGSSLTGSGPDEESLFEQHGDLWLLYSPNGIYYPGAVPTLAVSRVAFAEGQPYVAAFDGAVPGP